MHPNLQSWLFEQDPAYSRRHGSCTLSVATRNMSASELGEIWFTRDSTFKMEEHVRPVVLEHLSNQLHVHVLNVDLLVQPASAAREKCLLNDWPVDSCSRGWPLHWVSPDAVIYRIIKSEASRPTTLLTIRDSKRLCWDSCGLSFRGLFKVHTNVHQFAYHGVENK